jgi:drug/metabolite transporter (DMT)-like permease
MSSFLLALVSGFAHASWNALAKTAGHERAATWTTLALSWLVALAWWAAVGGTVGAAALPWVIVAGAGEAAYVFALGMAYARGELALTYAVSRAAALVFIWPLSWLVFGTTPSGWALGATLLVVVGILLARREGGADARWHPGWTLATGAAVALYHTGYKGAVDAGAAEAPAFVLALTLALPALLVLLGREVRAHIPALLRRPRLVVAGALCAASFLWMLAALAHADSGRILGVRNASVGFAVLLAVAGGERLARRQWAGVVVLFGGIALFALDPAVR